MKFKKLKQIKIPNIKRKWWSSHFMAPAAIKIGNKIRIFFGAWDKNKISRIAYLDINLINYKFINLSKKPILKLGKKNSIDWKGMFPASIQKFKKKYYLFYTGFSKNNKNEIISQSGLAVSADGKKFKKVNTKSLKVNNEGKIVRAGLSFLKEKKKIIHVYSAGSKWMNVGGKLRPTYNIFIQKNAKINNLEGKGKKIIKFNPRTEHALGRPQILKIKQKYYIFYTVRTLNMRYFIGCSTSDDLKKWKKNQKIFSKIKHGIKEKFDSSMIYFPSPLIIKNNILIFYSGNNFGQSGIGILKSKI